MAIRVNCAACGTPHNLADALASKKVRCKSCKAIITVPAAAAPPPPPPPPPIEEPLVEDVLPPPQPRVEVPLEAPEEPRRKPARAAEESFPVPQRGAAPRRPGPTPARKSGSKTFLLAGIGCFVLLLCLGGAGAAVWFFILGAAPQEQLVGVWQLDLQATKAANAAKWQLVPANLAIELNKDKSCRITMRDKEAVKGTWRVVTTKDKAITVELKLEGWAAAFQMTLTPKDKDHLQLRQCQLLADCELKRAATFPEPASYDSTPVIQPRATFKLNFGKAGTEEGKVSRIFVSADGSRVAVSNGGIQKNRTQVWDITGEPKKVYEGDGQVFALAPNGKHLLRSSTLTAGDIMDVDSGAKVASTDYSGMFTFFPNADTLLLVNLAPGGKPGLVFTLIDAKTGKKTTTVPAAPEIAAQASPPINDGREVPFLTAKPDKFRVVDVAAGNVVRDFALKVDAPYHVEPYGFTVSPDGKYVAATVAGGDTGVVTVFDGMTGAKVASLPRGVTLSQAGFLPGRDILLLPGIITQKEKKMGHVDYVAYDFVKEKPVAACRGIEKGIYQAAVSADGRVLVVGTQEGDVLVWDLAQIK